MSIQMCMTNEVADRDIGLTFSIPDSRDTKTYFTHGERRRSKQSAHDDLPQQLPFGSKSSSLPYSFQICACILEEWLKTRCV